MPGGTKRVTSAVAIATAFVLLSACQADPKPIEPSKSSPTTTRPTGKPVLPQKGHQNTFEGATTFVAYWVNTFNYAANTGNDDPLEDNSAAGCAGCSTYLEQIQKVYAAGGSYRGVSWTVGEVRVKSFGSGKSALVEISAPEAEIRSTAGGRWKRDAGFDNLLRFDLSYSDGKFEVTSLTRQVSS